MSNRKVTYFRVLSLPAVVIIVETPFVETWAMIFGRCRVLRRGFMLAWRCCSRRLLRHFRLWGEMHWVSPLRLRWESGRAAKTLPDQIKLSHMLQIGHQRNESTKRMYEKGDDCWHAHNYSAKEDNSSPPSLILSPYLAIYRVYLTNFIF